MGLSPLFAMTGIFSFVDRYVDKRLEKIVQGLAFEGETFANDAKDGGSYNDHTKNLRGSIAYDVFIGKESSISNYDGVDGSGARAEEAARNAVHDVIIQEGMHNTDITLIGVAGMEYAAAVESKGRTVLTPFIPPHERIKSLLKGAGLI